MLYEKLNAEMQETVDAWVGRLKVLSWQRRSDLLAESALPFGEDLPPDKAKTAARGFVTAVLERLDEDDVTDPYQALLYRVSLNPGHQEMAERYFAEHPEAAPI